MISPPNCSSQAKSGDLFQKPVGLPICVNSPHPNIIVCYSSGQPRAEFTVPGMVHECRRQLQTFQSAEGNGEERSIPVPVLQSRIKSLRSHDGSMATLKQHQEESYISGFELQTGVLHTSPSCCSSTGGEVLIFEKAFSRQGFPVPCPSEQKDAIPQTSSRCQTYISPMKRGNTILSSTSSASPHFFPLLF